MAKKDNILYIYSQIREIEQSLYSGFGEHRRYRSKINGQQKENLEKDIISLSNFLEIKKLSLIKDYLYTKIVSYIGFSKKQFTNAMYKNIIAEEKFEYVKDTHNLFEDLIIPINEFGNLLAVFDKYENEKATYKIDIYAMYRTMVLSIFSLLPENYKIELLKKNKLCMTAYENEILCETQKIHFDEIVDFQNIMIKYIKETYDFDVYKEAINTSKSRVLN